jgi:hypothetical protein
MQLGAPRVTATCKSEVPPTVGIQTHLEAISPAALPHLHGRHGRLLQSQLVVELATTNIHQGAHGGQHLIENTEAEIGLVERRIYALDKRATAGIFGYRPLPGIRPAA